LKSKCCWQLKQCTLSIQRYEKAVPFVSGILISSMLHKIKNYKNILVFSPSGKQIWEIYTMRKCVFHVLPILLATFTKKSYINL